MLYVTKLTFVVDVAGLQLPSLIRTRPKSRSAATILPGCDLFVALLAVLDARCLFDFLAMSLSALAVAVPLPSPLSYLSAARRVHHCVSASRAVRLPRAYLQHAIVSTRFCL